MATKKYVFAFVSSSEKTWNCQYSVRERDELAYTLFLYKNQ